MRALMAPVLGVASVLAGLTPAAAGTLTATTILQDFNAVIYTNGTTTADIEGASVIGGNFSGATVNNNPGEGQHVTQPTGFGVLNVFGSTSGNSINIDNGGSAYVAGAKGAQVNFNGGGKYLTTAPSPAIAGFETPLNALSTSLSQLAATAAAPTNPNAGQPFNNEPFKAVAGANGVAVFDLTAAQFNSLSSFTVNLNGASTVIFNVNGAAATDNANDESAPNGSNANGANDIIWNFYNATGTVAINNQLGGSVFAPGATVTNNNQIDGVLVANAFTGNGELHDYQFTGTLPSDPVSVPEPGSMALLASALLSFGLIRRRI